MHIQKNGSDNESRGVKTSLTAFLLILLIVISLSFYVYSRSRDEELKNISIKEWILSLLTKKENIETKVSAVMAETEEGDGDGALELGYDFSQHTVFCIYKGLLIRCTSDSVKGINSKGEEEWSRSVDLGKPLLKTNGIDILVVDLDGKMIYVFSGSNLKWEKKLEDKILNAEISEDGYVTVVHKANGYKAAVSAFDPYGISMFTRFVADNLVLSSKMYSSGKRFVINEVDISGTKAHSYLEFFESYEKPFAGVKLDEIMASIYYMKDGAVFTAGTTKAQYFDKDAKEKWSREYGKIYSSIPFGGKYVALAVDESDKPSSLGFRNTEIQVLNQHGEQVSTYHVGDEVRNVEAFDDIIAVNATREVHFINTGGKLLKKLAFKADVLQVHFFNKEEALVVTRNSAARVKI